MKHLSCEWVMYSDDRLVRRWRNLWTRQIVWQRKRVSKKCELSEEVRKVYAENGTFKAVALLRNLESLSWTDALAKLDKARKY